jgi:hypothetical protein
MKAIDVYEQNKRDIKIISDAMRKEAKPGHIENIGVFIGSAQPFEPDLEILSSQVVGGEILGKHTACQVVPVGTRDLKLTCIQTEKNKVKHLSDCVKSIGMDIMKELIDVSLEQESTAVDTIKKVRTGQLTNEQAAKEMKTRLAKSYRDEQEILNYYQKYKDSHCGKIIKTLSKIETKGDKVVEIETKSTEQINL